MKVQHPNSNIQGMFKLQHPRASGALLNQSYPKIVARGWELHEGESGKDHKHHFDLAERAAKFGEGVVRFSKRIPRDPGNDRLIGQLVGSGTSLGANYLEATEAVSKKDFKCSISRSAKEAKEAKFFLRMVAADEPTLAPEARELYREAHELHLIFAAIYRKK